MNVLSQICGQGIGFTIDGFRAVYVVIALFMWGMTALFSPEYFKHYDNKKRYYFFFIIPILICFERFYQFTNRFDRFSVAVHCLHYFGNIVRIFRIFAIL